jgi:hypothetical protein
MKVKELIAKLQECDPEMEVVVEDMDGYDHISTGISKYNNLLIIKADYK